MTVNKKKNILNKIQKELMNKKKYHNRRVKTMVNLKEILIVEDSPKDIELTLEALEEHNLANRVVVLRDGVEAMDYLKKRGEYINHKHFNPILVLLDIKMPKMDGLEVLAAIRSDADLKNIPVVMLTSSREEPDLRKCYELGVNAYVVKPVEFSDFIDAIKHVGVFWAILNQLPIDNT